MASRPAWDRNHGCSSHPTRKINTIRELWMKKETREKLVTVVAWILVAFFLGASLTIGQKVVNKYWQEPEKEIIVKHVYSVEK